MYTYVHVYVCVVSICTYVRFAVLYMHTTHTHVLYMHTTHTRVCNTHTTQTIHTHTHTLLGEGIEDAFYAALVVVSFNLEGQNSQKSAFIVAL